ncbi:HAD-IA family hydrolase [uncultured Tateyamaria sp.]|uniref:HAD-IA family hydrolase n=1 Tax=uncultured Tateyamaria sp. TaxID=455651 RepID=UPI00260BCFE2|nr:HAD-IA family hydrolase [uncultured Tateyamaria sp.]
MTARIVFDLDGTLIDSAPDIQGVANAVLQDMGVEPISLNDTRSFIGEGIHVLVSKVRAARDIPDSAQEVMLDAFIARYDEAVTLTVLYPGVRDALETLARTHRLGICTNKLYRPCAAVLKHLELDGFFASVWGGDNPLGRKPDPSALLAAFEALGDGPPIYVGDSEVDAETARRASIPFFLFTEGYRKQSVDTMHHDVAFGNFEDLPELVETHIRQL